MPSTAPKLTEAQIAEIAKILGRDKETARNANIAPLRAKKPAGARNKAGNIVPFPEKKPAVKAPIARPASAQKTSTNVIQMAPVVEEFGPTEEFLGEGEAELEENEEGGEAEEAEESGVKEEETEEKKDKKDEKEKQDEENPDEASQEKELADKKEQAKNESKPGEGITPISEESPFARGEKGGELGREKEEAQEAEEAGKKPGAEEKKSGAETSQESSQEAGGKKAKEKSISKSQEEARNAKAKDEGESEKGEEGPDPTQIAVEMAKKRFKQWLIGVIAGALIAAAPYILIGLVIIAVVAIVYMVQQNCGWIDMAKIGYSAYFNDLGKVLTEGLKCAFGK